MPGPSSANSVYRAMLLQRERRQQEQMLQDQIKQEQGNAVWDQQFRQQEHEANQLQSDRDFQLKQAAQMAQDKEQSRRYAMDVGQQGSQMAMDQAKVVRSEAPYEDPEMERMRQMGIGRADAELSRVMAEDRVARRDAQTAATNKRSLETFKQQEQNERDLVTNYYEHQQFGPEGPPEGEGWDPSVLMPGGSGWYQRYDPRKAATRAASAKSKAFAGSPTDVALKLARLYGTNYGPGELGFDNAAQAQKFYAGMMQALRNAESAAASQQIDLPGKLTNLEGFTRTAPYASKADIRDRDTTEELDIDEERFGGR